MADNGRFRQKTGLPTKQNLLMSSFVEISVFENEERCLARFKSLLSLFGLEDRLISSVDDYNKIKDKPIDWGGVNQNRNEKREESMRFLAEALN